MVDVMRFGAGWEGEVLQIDSGLEKFSYTPRPEFTPANPTIDKTPDDNFQLHDFLVITHLVDGIPYLVAYTGALPKKEMVNKAVREHMPRPIGNN